MKNIKNLTKRGFALFIALVLCMSTMTLTAFAADEDTNGETPTESVEIKEPKKEETEESKETESEKEESEESATEEEQEEESKDEEEQDQNDLDVQEEEVNANENTPTLFTEEPTTVDNLSKLLVQSEDGNFKLSYEGTTINVTGVTTLSTYKTYTIDLNGCTIDGNNTTQIFNITGATSPSSTAH